jgi:hypothetical protein
VAGLKFPLVHHLGNRYGLNRQEKMGVGGHHDVAQQDKWTTRADVAKEGQNQVAFGWGERRAAVQEICGDEEDAILVGDPSEPRHKE